MATTASTQASAMRRLLQAAVTGDRDAMADLVTADVTGWSPNPVRHLPRRPAHSNGAPRRRLFRDRGPVQAVEQVGDKAIAEWHVAVDHTGLLVVDDDLTIEPTGRRLHVSGATVAEFEGDRICAFRSYFDDLALLEQVLAET